MIIIQIPINISGHQNFTNLHGAYTQVAKGKYLFLLDTNQQPGNSLFLSLANKPPSIAAAASTIQPLCPPLSL